MKNLFGILLLFLFSIQFLAAQNPPLLPVWPIKLENDFVILKSDGKYITSLYDKDRGIEHISPDYETSGGFFKVGYVNSRMANAGTVQASSMTQVNVIFSNSSRATIRLENDVLIALVDMELKPTAAEVAWNIRVELKNNEYDVSQVDFPKFRTPLVYNEVVKQFIDPSFEGRIYALNDTNHDSYSSSYPAKQGLQMSAFISTAGSILVWANDINGHVKSFGHEISGTSSNVAIRHLMPYESHVWEASYQSIISLCGNQWEDAAEIYRNWAVQQAWSSTLLKNRTDIDKKFHNSSMVVHSPADIEYEQGILPTVHTRIKAWSDKFGVPVIYRPLGWEKYDYWAGIDYFPPYIGEENFRDMNSFLKADGNSTAGFIEGFHWTIKLYSEPDDGPNNTALTNYFTDNNGALLCRKQLNGVLYKLTSKDDNENPIRDANFLCRGTTKGNTFLQGVASELFNLGISHIHNDYDHLMGLSGPCYDKSHGHPVPYGKWEADLMETVYSDIIQEAKTRNIPDFTLTKEWPSEIHNMILHGYQARNWKIVSSIPSTIPLFLYVYHDYIPAIFGLCTANQSNSVELAASIIYGQIQSLAFWGTTIKNPSMGTNSENILKDYFAGMKIYAKDYLLYGHLMKSAVLTSTGNIHNTWQTNTGDVAVFAINPLDINQEITVKIPGSSTKYMRVYQGGTLVSSSEVNGGETYTWNVVPWRMSAVVFSDNRTITWTGSSGTNWNNPANWSPNVVPTATDNVILADVTNDPIVNQNPESAAVCNHLSVNSGVILTINEGKALTVNGNLTNNSNAKILLKGDATGTGSLIVKGMSEGTGISVAERWMKASKWSLVSPPLQGQAVSEFISTNINIPTHGNERGIMDYNPASNVWNGFFLNDIDYGNMAAGKGYSMRIDGLADNKINFTGSISSGTTTLTGLTGSAFNLVGNPFTSAIGINQSSRSESKFLTANADLLDPSYGAIYLWEISDAERLAGGQYTVISNVNIDPYEIQQGQGFFVKLKSGVNTLRFNNNMQVHLPTIPLKSAAAPNPSIQLTATSGKEKSTTLISFIDRMNEGLDPTFDAGFFKGTSSLSLFSLLVDGDETPFSIQALPKGSRASVKLGLENFDGGEVMISATSLNLPISCKPVLEDKLAQVFTDLSRNTYKFMTVSHENTTDRLVLHTSGLATSSLLINAGEITAYLVGNSEILISGKVNKGTVAWLYDVQGRLIRVVNLKEGTKNAMSLPEIASAVYFLKIKNDNLIKTIKICN